VSACDDGDKLVLDELPQHRVLTTQVRAAAQAAYIESSEWAIATCGRDLLEAAKLARSQRQASNGYRLRLLRKRFDILRSATGWCKSQGVRLAHA